MAKCTILPVDGGEPLVLEGTSYAELLQFLCQTDHEGASIYLELAGEGCYKALEVLAADKEDDK